MQSPLSAKKGKSNLAVGNDMICHNQVMSLNCRQIKLSNRTFSPINRLKTDRRW